MKLKHCRLQKCVQKAMVIGALGTIACTTQAADTTARSTNVSSLAVQQSSTFINDEIHTAFSYESRTGNKRRSKLIKGVPVTGANQYCGQQRWSFEDQGINVLSFRQVAEYAPGAIFPELLSATNCDADAILASTHDTQLSFDPPGPATGITDAPDPRLENVPLRDVPKNAGVLQGGITGVRNFIDNPTQTPVNPFPVVQALASDPITLGDWSKASGQLRFACRSDGTAWVTIRMRNLIPNGVYSMWGIWKTPLPIGIFVDLPVPFGGLPNAVVPDHRGNAVFVRKVPFCPSEETADGSQLLWVTAAYHSDANLYGGVPDAANLRPTFIDKDGNAFESNLSLMVHHEHLAFPVNFTRDLLAQ